MCGYGCWGISVRVLGTGADPRRARGVRHPFQAILRLTLRGQTTMAHIALFANALAGTQRTLTGTIRLTPPPSRAPPMSVAGVPDRMGGPGGGGPGTERLGGRQMGQAERCPRQSPDDGERTGPRPEALAQWPATEKRSSRGCCGRSWAGCSRTTPACGC